MKQREFGQKLGGSAIGAALAIPETVSAPTAPRTKTLMRVGGDYHSAAGRNRITSKENLEYNLRHGVKHLTAQMRNRPQGGGWDADELKRMKDDCDHHGVIFQTIRMDSDYITLPKGAERDRQLETILGGLHNFAEVYPDEGAMNFFPIMRVLRDTQFAGAICPDHRPRHPDDPACLQAFAFGYGYIKALIQAVKADV